MCRACRSGTRVVAFAVTALLTAACGGVIPVPSATSAPSASPSGLAAVAIPAGAVAWADLPFQPYLPSPFATPSAVPAKPCRLPDLSEQPPGMAAGFGNEAVVFDFVNRTSHTCLASGSPHVAVSLPGHPTVVATPGGVFDQHLPPADLLPGAHTGFAVGFAYSCLTGTGPPLYDHVTVTLPGGGTFAQSLSGLQGVNGRLTTGIEVGCGVTVTELYVPPPQSAYPTDPMVGLTVSAQMPPSVRIGQTVVYLVTLSNPTSTALVLNPCRGYFQMLDSTKTASSFYQLNCDAAHPIPAYGSESFVMRMQSYSIEPGAHSLCWTLDTGPASGPQACKSIRFDS
jgi:hypothetical protein